MKRWLVVLLVLLALIILVSPGVIGRLAEQNMESNIEWAESESPGVKFATESYERGWFTSAGTHRLVLEGGQFRDATEKYAAATGNPALPSLLIDTRFDHGLVPVSSLSRDAGSLLPGLASTISTFRLDPGNGEVVGLPGTLYSNISLGGASDSRLLVETGNVELEDVMVNWQGADLKFYSDRRSGELSVHGAIEPWQISGDNGGASFGSIRIDADLVRTGYGFNVGTADFSLDSVTIDDDAQKIVFGGMTGNMDSAIEDGRYNSSGSINVKEFTVPGFGDVAMDMSMSMNRFDAESLGTVVKALREAQAADDPAAAMEMLYPRIEGDLQALAAAGAEIRFDRFDIRLPQGTVESRIVIDVAEKDSNAAFSWPGVLMDMSATIDLKIPVPLFDMATMMNPQAGSLVAMGILQKDGEVYVMEAEYAKGLVNVNGAPMPIPIPGL